MKTIVSLVLFLILIQVAFVSVSGEEEKVELKCDSPGQVVEAGDTASFSFTIKNNYDATKMFTLRYNAPDVPDWDIKFKDGEKEVYKVLLAKGGSKSLKLDVETTGDTKVGEYVINARVGGRSIRFYIYIAETHRGEKGTLELTIMDKEGNTIENALVSAYKGDKLVDQAMTTSEGKLSMELPKGTYKIKITKDGYKGKEVNDIKIRVKRTTDIGSLSIEKEIYFALVSVKTPLKGVMAGEHPNYEIKIKNIGSRDDTYRLTFQDLPEGWYARYKETAESTEEIAGIFIGSGSEKALYLKIITPYDVEIGDYNFSSVILSSAWSHELDLVLKVRGSYDMGVYPERYRYEVKKGDTVSFDVLVANEGRGGSFSNIVAEASAPGGWDVIVEPGSISSLKPGDKGTFTLDVTPPGDIVASDYKLVLKIECDQLEQEEEFRITVKESSNIAIYGVLIILVVVVGLWYVYKKYGRR
jgi:uncharacterized membrane protein